MGATRRRIKGSHRVEIEGSAIGPAAKRARKRCYRGLAGRIPMTSAGDWNSDFKNARAADPGDELFQPFDPKPEIGRLTTPVAEQKLNSAVFGEDRVGRHPESSGARVLLFMKGTCRVESVGVDG